METGQLNRRVQVLRAAAIDDGLQARPGPFVAYGGPIWAAKRDVSDAERFAAGTLAAGITTRFQVRHWSFTESIRETDRLACEGRTYAIVGIKEIGQRAGLEITATRIMP